MIELGVSLLVCVVLSVTYALRLGQLDRLATALGGQRLLTGGRALQTRDYVLEIVAAGWRVAVPGCLLGGRMGLTIQPGLSPLGVRTGFGDVDHSFRITSDDEALAATIMSDPVVRKTLHRLDQLTNLKSINVTSTQALVVLFRRRRRVDEVETLEAVVAFARALNGVATVRAQLTAGGPTGGIGGASGSPFAMPGAR